MKSCPSPASRERVARAQPAPGEGTLQTKGSFACPHPPSATRWVPPSPAMREREPLACLDANVHGDLVAVTRTQERTHGFEGTVAVTRTWSSRAAKRSRGVSAIVVGLAQAEAAGPRSL